MLTDIASFYAFRKLFEDLRERIYEQCLEGYEEYRETEKDGRIVFVSEWKRNAFNKYFSRVCKLVHGISIACKK